MILEKSLDDLTYEQPLGQIKDLEMKPILALQEIVLALGDFYLDHRNYKQVQILALYEILPLENFQHCTNHIIKKVLKKFSDPSPVIDDPLSECPKDPFRTQHLQRKFSTLRAKLN